MLKNKFPKGRNMLPNPNWDSLEFNGRSTVRPSAAVIRHSASSLKESLGSRHGKGPLPSQLCREANMLLILLLEVLPHEGGGALENWFPGLP
jgi:hypothetical protein